MSDPTDDTINEDYCGCCGRQIDTFHLWWCHRCIRHVTARGPLHERTWFAQYGTDCPNQEPRS